MQDAKMLPMLRGNITDITSDRKFLHFTFESYTENKNFELIPQGLKMRSVEIPKTQQAYEFAKWMDGQMPAQKGGKFSISNVGINVDFKKNVMVNFEFKSSDKTTFIDDMVPGKTSEFEMIIVSVRIGGGKISAEVDATNRRSTEEPFKFYPKTAEQLESILYKLKSLPIKNRDEMMGSVKKRLELAEEPPKSNKTALGLK